MLSDYISRLFKPVHKEPVVNNFLDKPYYADFLKQLKLKEIKDEMQHLQAYQGEKNWSVSLDDVAMAMQTMQMQGNLKSPETLSILKFVIDKSDRNKHVPQFIRTYMCRDAVSRAILQRFNEATGGLHTSLTELSYKISDNIEEANEIFNSIRFCDPAMGSGLFLVTLLNEMIAAKSQLGILADEDGNPLFHYKIVADHEDLLVIDRKNCKTFQFSFADPENRRIQETFLREKRTIIENCLYGVDIDPVSVSISKLRLWAELLKHVCWSKEQIQSFPVVEFNFRCGDSLVSRFSIHEDLKNLFKRIGYSVIDYKKKALEYKNAQTKAEKKAQEQWIALIKRKLHQEITADARNRDDLLKWKKELTTLKTPGLFEMDENEAKTVKTKLNEAQSMVDKFTQKIEDAKNNPFFEHAIEWRYEFPEMLNASGDFIGFDCIIGNPPDTQNQSVNISRQMHHHAYKLIGEGAGLFYELGYKLLKPDCFLSYITSNSWMKSVSAGKIRQYLMDETNPLLMIEFNSTEKTEKIVTTQCITLFQKTRNQYRMMSCQVKEDFDPVSASLEDYIRKNAKLSITESENKDVGPTFTILPDTEKHIKHKIEQTGTSLEAWDIQLYSGIKTGCDEAFVIDGKTKDEFVRADYKNLDIIKPLLPGKNIRRYIPEKSNLWLICIPWHFPLLFDKTIKSASIRAEERFRQQYPVIYKHLSKFKEALIARSPREVGTIFEWYALQRFGTGNEWETFTQPKIVWKKETATPNFCLDYSGCAVMDSTCFITGQHLKYLLGVLNSKLGRYMLHDSPRMPNGDMQLSILTLEALKIPVSNIKIESEIISLVNKRTSDTHQNDYGEIDDKINQLVYDMYGLEADEREYLETI